MVDYKSCSKGDWWGRSVNRNMVCAGGGALSGCQVSDKKNKQKKTQQKQNNMNNNKILFNFMALFKTLKDTLKDRIEVIEGKLIN